MGRHSGHNKSCKYPCFPVWRQVQTTLMLLKSVGTSIDSFKWCRMRLIEPNIKVWVKIEKRCDSDCQVWFSLISINLKSFKYVAGVKMTKIFIFFAQISVQTN